MIKLFYVNNYGQIVNPDSSLWLASDSNKVAYERFDSMNEATGIAEVFVSCYPSMSCLLYDGDSMEETIISQKEA